MHRILVALALFAFAPATYAQPSGKAPPAKAEGKKDDKGGKDKDDKSKGEKGKDDKDGKGKDDKDKGDKDKDGKKPELPKLDKAQAKERAKAERDALKAKVGKHLAKGKNAALTEELRHHAQRLAKLDRIMQVAKANGDTETEAKAKKLIDKETARHDKFMANLDKSEKGAGK
jgi:hypothetical protein